MFLWLRLGLSGLSFFGFFRRLSGVFGRLIGLLIRFLLLGVLLGCWGDVVFGGIGFRFFCLALFCCSGVLRWLVVLAVDLACRSGLLLCLVALACCSGVSSVLAIPGVFRCHSMALRNTFQKTKSIQKSFSPIICPAGCLRQFSKSCHQRARADRTSCVPALSAPSMALQPVAEMILKTD